MSQGSTLRGRRSGQMSGALAGFRDHQGRHAYDHECGEFLTDDAAHAASDNPEVYTWVRWLTDAEAVGLR